MHEEERSLGVPRWRPDSLARSRPEGAPRGPGRPSRPERGAVYDQPMSWLRSSVKDDRGVLAPLISGPLSVHSAGEARLGFALRCSIERSIRLDDRQQLVTGAKALLLSFPFWAPSALMPAVVIQSREVIPVWIGFSLMIPVGLAGPLAFTWVFRRLVACEVAQAYADRGLCGSCGYGLADAKPEADGCRVCPECGSAWLAERPAERAHAASETP